MGREIWMGGAHGDERGNATGGAAGDQTGREVCEGKYKRHSQGWLVFRAYDATVRDKLAYAMRRACDNPAIGYDQNQRNSLYKLAGKVNYDPGRVVTACETDCSALVRVCCAYAGIMLPDFNTESEPGVLRKSGKFGEVSLDKNALQVGDILVTPRKGHTEIITRIEYTGSAENTKGSDEMDVLREGDRGHQVRVLQALLNTFACVCLGVDGEFGPKTRQAVQSFQAAQSLTVDGVVGKNTWNRLLKGK